ncbi:MAG: hypothetical protein JW957_03435 [Candidatus Omnitrophica bacterium]|nr:hypothetical protein [Candidatus Omnitrophota bacterium]
MKFFLFILLILKLTVFADIILYAPFDSSVELKGSTGNISAEYSGTMIFQGDARRDKALLMADKNREEQLTYIFNEPFLREEGSLDFWIQPAAWTGVERKSPFVINLKIAEDFRVQIFKEQKTSNLIFHVHANGTENTMFIPIYNWSAKRWQHILINKNGKEISFHVNGQKAVRYEKSVVFPEKILSEQDYYLSILTGEATALDEMRIYNQSFSTDEIEEKYITAFLKDIGYTVPAVRIPYAARPPSTDGGIDIKLWEQAAIITDFMNLYSKGKQKEQETWVHIMYDDSRLYMLFKSPVPEERLAGGPQERDVLAQADEIEFFVMPKYTETFDYFQFVGNPWESMYDGRGHKESEWNGDWFYRCRVDEKWWYAELWVNDFAPIGAGTPFENDVWKANFCRNWRSGKFRDKPWTLWSLVSGGYHDYNRFGKIIFGGKETVVPKIETIAETDSGKNTVSAIFSLENLFSAQRTIIVRYLFYPSGDYFPSSAISRKILLQPGQKQNIKIDNDLKDHKKGLVEIEIRDEETGKVYFSQMVRITVQ